MRVQVICPDNGYGLSKDIAVLRTAFEGHEVTVTPSNATQRRESFDLNIHVEHLELRHTANGRVNAAIPNPDWFELKWIQRLERMDLVLAKTRDTERIFQPWHKGVRYIGFTSPDPGVLVDYDRNEFFHGAGQSSMKGTQAVLDALAYTKTRATVLWSKRPRSTPSPNVRFIGNRLPDSAFAELRRAPVHLCPSTYEGFGHYINEARAMGAVIVTTDAPPMSELLGATFGFRVPVANVTAHHAAPQYHVTASALADAMDLAMSNPQHWKTWGDRARTAYLQGREEFRANIAKLISEIA